MQTARTLVLLDLTPEASDLADCLVAAGHDVILADWHARRLAGTAGTAPWPDVLVTDRRALGDTDPLLAAEIVSQQVGIVAIGTNLAADVTLPADVQGRELILAVDLVTRLVRLRRTHQDVDQDRRRWIDLAMHDPLTGLPNRRAWQQELERRLAAGGPLGLALIDVDFFKRINDQGGHDVGDIVLREVAQAMRRYLRLDDYVARLGGDEFALLIFSDDPATAQTIIDRLRHRVSRHLVERQLPPATLSAGYVFALRPDPADPQRLYAAAARLLQKAKQASRDCTVATVLS